jgi:hypothetical protein
VSAHVFTYDACAIRIRGKPDEVKVGRSEFLTSHRSTAFGQEIKGQSGGGEKED